MTEPKIIIDRIIVDKENQEWLVKVSDKRSIDIYASYDEARNRAETIKIKTGLDISDMYYGYFIKPKKKK